MLDLILRGLLVFLMLLVGAELAFWLIVFLPPLHDNAELAASLIGVAGTLTAAWLAWQAVQEQVKTTREQFRHQMMVMTAADRADATRDAARAKALLERIASLCDRIKIARGGAPPRPVGGYLRALKNMAEGFENWRAEIGIIRRNLTPEQDTTLLTFSVLLGDYEQYFGSLGNDELDTITHDARECHALVEAAEVAIKQRGLV